MLRNRENKKIVSIISRESDEPSTDIVMLRDELASRGIEVRTLCRLLRKEKSLKALSYAGEIAKQIGAMRSSSVVVVDTYIIPVSMLPHGRGTKVVQTWHALSAIKKFGWQTVGRSGGSSERVARLMRMHRGYDYVVCCSDVTAGHFSEAFRTPLSRTVKAGLPRIDYIRELSSGDRRGETLQRIYSRYPDLKCNKEAGKRLLLYAPTFRPGGSVDVRGVIEAADPEKWNIVVKLHPLDRNDRSSGGAVFDDEFSSFEWLAAADARVSDYSSLAVEASLADRPLFIYAYDMEEYDRTVGLNIDFSKEAIAPYVCGTGSELKEALDADYDMDLLREFRKRYIDIDTTDCTAALADFIESLL